jgi:hypothetical protein
MKMHHPHGVAIGIRIDQHGVHDALNSRLSADPRASVITQTKAKRGLIRN